MYEYAAIINRVVDGDTFEATVDIGFSLSFRHKFRLHSVDTPETHRPKSQGELAHGLEATQYVKELIEKKEVVIRTHKLGIYGRYEAEVILKDGTSLADRLTERGLLKRDHYDG